MPFVKVDIKAEIEKELNSDPEFKEIWESTQMEYELLRELIRLRKEKGFTQKELAQKTGKHQQAISRIEKQEKSPTIATLCNIANALGVDVRLVPRQ